jgi:hypothetical protein
LKPITCIVRKDGSTKIHIKGAVVDEEEDSPEDKAIMAEAAKELAGGDAFLLLRYKPLANGNCAIVVDSNVSVLNQLTIVALSVEAITGIPNTDERGAVASLLGRVRR